MSTRCQIRVIKDGCVLNLYHHCDGYFEGVGLELQELLNQSKEDDYEFMRLIQSKNEYRITFDLHGDIEYFYLINFDTKEFFGWHIKFSKNIWKNVTKKDKNWFSAMPDIENESKINLLIYS